MQITKENIEESERILIPGKKFDKERQLFIKTLTSCDLLAVPGSGKTTALQAKLYCLSKNLPLPNNQGLLILSHTNTAVIEIKAKLQSICPNLFNYPNFVGTVQDFVDTFLAIPFYHRTYGHKITKIDKGLYDKEFTTLLKKSLRTDNPVWTWYVMRGVEQPLKFNYRINKGLIEPWDYNAQKPFVFVSNPPKTWGLNTKDNILYIKDKLNGLKEFLLNKGILNFDDCYFFAQLSLVQHPQLIDLLRLRFPYVFIDETQDLQLHQIEIIDEIFDCNEVCLQRVGDINQAIFNSGSKSEGCFWIPRNVLTINNSMRVTSEIAGIVNPFMTIRNSEQKIIGLRCLKKRIPPFLFVYDFEHKDRLKQKFIDLINYYNLYETYEGQKYGFHIIGWNVRWPEGVSLNPNKLRLADIFPEVKAFKGIDSSNNKTLDWYLNESRKINTTGKKCRLIEDIVCECLNCCGQTYLVNNNGTSYGSVFTPSLLRKYIECQSLPFVNEYRCNLLNIVRSMSLSKYEELYKIIPEFISWFLKSLSIKETEELSAFFECDGNVEVKKSDDIVLVEKVHNVKGQTHCATLYVETMYNGSYESMHVLDKIKKKATKKTPAEYYSNPFYKEFSIINERVHAQSALKMLYVGMSRPTHLLCYAMHKSSFLQYDENRLTKCGWVILDLTKDF